VGGSGRPRLGRRAQTRRPLARLDKGTTTSGARARQRRRRREGKRRRCKTLNLASQRIGSDGSWANAAEELGTDSALQDLSLAGDAIGLDGARALATARRQLSDTSTSSRTTSTTKRLCSFETKCTLQRLSVFSTAGLASPGNHIQPALHMNRTLQALDLRSTVSATTSRTSWRTASASTSAR
jgi:hypothetical protein